MKNRRKVQKSAKKLIPYGISNPSFDFQDYVPYLLNQARFVILPMFTKALVDPNLTIAGWRILATLHKHGPLRVRELLPLTGVEPPTLSRNLASLEKRRLISRFTSEDDARGILVEATPEGISITNALIPHAIAVEKKALGDFTDDEKQFLIKLLKRIWKNMDCGRSHMSDETEVE